MSAVICQPAGSQQTSALRNVRGVVRDTAAHPVPYANVNIGGSRYAITDDSGMFRIDVPRQIRVLLEVRRLGFQPTNVNLDAGTDTTISIELFPVPVGVARIAPPAAARELISSCSTSRSNLIRPASFR